MRIERLRRAVSGFEMVGDADVLLIPQKLSECDTGGFVSARKG